MPRIRVASDAGRGEKTAVYVSKIQQKLRDWFSLHGRDLPWRRNLDPYAILVSEFMLQQTQVATVIPFYERWLKRFPDFASLAVAEEQEVLRFWQGLGYYARARNLHRAAQAVCAEYGGVLPADEVLIGRLPGVGRYTAGALASFAFNRAAPAVDANIARVLARLDDLRIPIDSVAGLRRLWQLAAELVPNDSPRLHNWALMELGALVCTPRNPKCHACPVRGECQASDPEGLPVKKARRPVVDVVEACLFQIENYHLRMERSSGTRWSGLWRLPRLDAVPEGTPLCEERYAFTHHRVLLKVFGGPPGSLGEKGELVELSALHRLPMAAADARVVKRLLDLTTG
jgi:A/G-specific adenine glycosylase